MIDDKMAKMAINTLKEYCKNLCSRCAVYGSCSQKYCYFENVDGYNDVGTLEDLQKSTGKPPKFDIRQKDSAAFRNYINKIFMEEAEKYGLPMNTANSIKWTARGTIVVTFVDDDNKMDYIGVAKCHPDDAFNPEIGIKLAIERAAQAMKAPFVPAKDEAYYYVDDENLIYSTINHHTNTDILNIALGNCFRKHKEAHANKEAIRKRMERAKVLLKSLREDDANAMGRCK
ncbi:hypothetical protein G153_08204 [Megasphaera sp. BL7]|uniref:hypothetical protein n=1 Tax=unclassified Megasphaera TaxID=2626256 RepID=UPI0003577500|nr:MULTISPECIES: hypothetical protein [unclassified Megasphaera]EPP15859.1 hypothetical protein G153_08204 [Megasphaera sp. BL7]EPP18940.1 hypothetical protein NM10_01109 [Megasphaera sp. NM10]